MSLLTIQDLTISHNKQNILNNINLKLNTAEIIGIVAYISALEPGNDPG